MAAEVLPELKGQDLAGSPLALPQALSGRAGILLVGFSHASGPGTKAVERGLWADLEGNSKVVVYSVAQFEGAPSFVIPMILRKIKKERPESRWGELLVLRKGRKDLEALVGFDKSAPDDTYALVLSPKGEIRLRTRSKELKAAELLQALK